MEFCERHGSGSQPGGGICAVCLQEKLILLWRGEGQNANWDTEEFCVTPPPVLEEEEQERPSLPEEADDDDEAGPRVGTSSSFAACFPIRFRVKNDDHEREKIDRSQFSCELKSILKELAALHDKKKRRTGTESGSLSARRPPHYDESARDETEAVPRAKARSIVEEDDDEEEARYRKVMCFSAMWPAILNMKWARVLVSPILSSNKIAPSKSDLLSKVDPQQQRQESGRNCETSGSEQHLERAPTPALLPPLHHPADNEDGGLEIDKETKLRMEASRITVMTWLQSLPSPKAVQLDHHNLKGLPDDISLGNGVLEMCDEEEVEFDHRHSQEIDVYAHMASFGKFLQSSPQIAYAPQQTRMVDIEIAAQ